MPPEALPVTALVLAGGRGSRMGGADKGLQLLDGVPLALHVAKKVGSAVSAVAINANRHQEEYSRLGYALIPDADPAAFQGPLAGISAGLARACTPWLLVLPCDAPFFPSDLPQRLFEAATSRGAEVAVACDAPPRPERWQPAFCLLSTSLNAPLQAFLKAGGRKVETFLRSRTWVAVPFDQADRVFANLNTQEELAAAQSPARLG